jgi:hypothetical protein
MPSSKAIMFPCWHTANLVLENHIQWEHLDHLNKVTWRSWVSCSCRRVRIHKAVVSSSPCSSIRDHEANTNAVLGVIPRAGAALFEKLDGARPSNRNSMSGLRTPTRYSANAATMLAKGAEKNWTLKATYVRSTMSNCEIYCFQRMSHTMSEGL